MFRILAVFLLAAATIASAGPAGAAGGLRVAAAASLTTAMRELARDFESETGTPVVLSFASTGKLAFQVSRGAPFDVFFAADTAHVEGLVKEGHVDGDTVVVYARGRLVIAVNETSGVEVADPVDLLSRGIRRVAIANPDHAPYGIAAREALVTSGVWEALRPRIVYGENVRQAMVFVSTGNAEAGLVAMSVADSKGVRVVPVDPSLYTPLEQAAAV
ncbi:MAG TPA: molybdate ABC transporter substrate-binding protein, partial [Gammaproteobacteria bacterium]|nr:molybdate ABC transporter substrate-binding protein [Gammaproteobacteria bacterium]